MSHKNYYTGDRMDSLKLYGQPYDLVAVFSYDADGRLTHSSSNYGEFCDYYYDSDGNVSRYVEYMLVNSTDTFSVKTANYTWASGHIQRIECHYTYDSASTHQDNYYTWNGDRLVSTVCYSENSNGRRDTSAYTYEFSNIKNPFYGSVYWQRTTSLYSFTQSGLEGFCPYVVKHITGIENTSGDIQYELTTSGGRLTGIHEASYNERADMRLRMTTDYEFEY